MTTTSRSLGKQLYKDASDTSRLSTMYYLDPPYISGPFTVVGGTGRETGARVEPAAVEDAN